VVTADSGKITRIVLVCIASEVGFCILLNIPTTAGSAPWFDNVRQVEQIRRATSADDPVLRNRILSLSPTVRRIDADRVVNCAYSTGRELSRQWRVFWLAGVQNFLVNTGARKGGLCFQWATELLIRLNALKLQTLDLHWAEALAGTGGEHNVIVVTAKGQAFEEGIILDNWRYEGRLVYCRTALDPEYRWKENPGEFARRLNANSTNTLPSRPVDRQNRRSTPR
jgi:hypothetical protein